MKNQRRKFSEEFKSKIVQEVVMNEKAIAAIARKFDLSPGQINAWKRRKNEKIKNEK